VGQTAPRTPASSSASTAAAACGASPEGRLPLGITQRFVSREVTRRMLTGASTALPLERYGRAATWRMTGSSLLLRPIVTAS